MWLHKEIGKTFNEQKQLLKKLIHHGDIKFGGNKRLKIYGTLICASGKKMKIENRVFFNSESEARSNGYRPCGHCMKKEYAVWKRKINLLHKR